MSNTTVKKFVENKPPEQFRIVEAEYHLQRLEQLCKEWNRFGLGAETGAFLNAIGSVYDMANVTDENESRSPKISDQLFSDPDFVLLRELRNINVHKLNIGSGPDRSFGHDMRTSCVPRLYFLTANNLLQRRKATLTRAPQIRNCDTAINRVSDLETSCGGSDFMKLLPYLRRVLEAVAQICQLSTFGGDLLSGTGPFKGKAGGGSAASGDIGVTDETLNIGETIKKLLNPGTPEERELE